MRCACAACGAFMVQADQAARCACPDCGANCSACLGSGEVLQGEALLSAAQRLLQNQLAKEAAARHSGFSEQHEP